MKRNYLIALMFLATAGFAAAQGPNFSPQTDVLGAHLNYGRGCAGCHAPHNGAYGNGAAKTTDLTSGQSILWGEDVGSLYNQTITTGGVTGRGSYSETLPGSMSATGPDVNGLLTCLSCHDGNYATGAMMKNQVYESLPSTYGKYNLVPTLLGVAPGGGNPSYLQDHPVGLSATVKCGGQYNWDCTETNGVIIMNGTNSSKFVQNYGYFVSTSSYTGPAVGGVTPSPVAVVVCTTCHNQHLMNVVKVSAVKTASNGAISGSGQTPGFYQTMFFLAGPYNPGSGTANSNQTAQFCRQCHGGEANESNNGAAVTTF
jgi:hypothetical protein